MNAHVTRISVVLCLGACGPKSGGTPTVGQIFAAHDKAVGLVEVSTLSMNMRTEMVDQGMSMSSSMVLAMPDRVMTTTEIPGIGDLVTAYDGETGWEVHPLMGSRILEGDDLEAVLLPLEEMRSLAISERYPTATLIGEEDFHGTLAWKVDATDARGQQFTLWFDKESKYQIGKQTLQETDAGSLLVTSQLQDYRSTGVGMTPFTVLLDMSGMSMVTHIEAFEANGTELPDFSPPASLRPGAEEPEPSDTATESSEGAEGDDTAGEPPAEPDSED